MSVTITDGKGQVVDGLESRDFLVLDNGWAQKVSVVSAAMEHLRKYLTHRRVLLISESKDRGSQTDLAAATVAGQMGGVTVYAATYSAFRTGFTSKTPNDEPGLRDAVAPMHNPNRTVDGEFSNPRNPKLITRQSSVDLSAVLVELARLSQNRGSTGIDK